MWEELGAFYNKLMAYKFTTIFTIFDSTIDATVVIATEIALDIPWIKKILKQKNSPKI